MTKNQMRSLEDPADATDNKCHPNAPTPLITMCTSNQITNAFINLTLLSEL